MLKLGLSRWILNPLFLLAKAQESKRLQSLKNIYNEDKRCFIIGNGASIKRQDLTKMREEVTFVTNSFILHEEYELIRPNYYCISDSRPFRDPESMSRLVSQLSQKAKHTKKFFPLREYFRIKKTDLSDKQDVWYLNYIYFPIWETGEVSLDISRKVYTGDTVIIDFCLPIAYYMGFKTVYILGCDCTLGTTNHKNETGHFYDNAQHIGQQQEKEYLKNFWFDRVRTSYRIIKKYYEGHGRKIYNAGDGGKLDVFDRVNYNNLFN